MGVSPEIFAELCRRRSGVSPEILRRIEELQNNVRALMELNAEHEDHIERLELKLMRALTAKRQLQRYYQERRNKKS